MRPKLVCLGGVIGGAGAFPVGSPWEGVACPDRCSFVSPATPAPQSFLGVGLPTEFGQNLATQAGASGYRCSLVGSLTALVDTCRSVRPSVAALFLDVDPALQILRCMRTGLRDTPIVAITDLPSLLRASEAIREGAHAVLARPTAFSQILAACGLTTAIDVQPMSLDRAIWEYLNQVVIEEGSISGAARRLRLDRTSLKRKLRKLPPSR